MTFNAGRFDAAVASDFTDIRRLFAGDGTQPGCVHDTRRSRPEVHEGGRPSEEHNDRLTQQVSALNKRIADLTDRLALRRAGAAEGIHRRRFGDDAAQERRRRRSSSLGGQYRSSEAEHQGYRCTHNTRGAVAYQADQRAVQLPARARGAALRRRLAPSRCRQGGRRPAGPDRPPRGALEGDGDHHRAAEHAEPRRRRPVAATARRALHLHDRTAGRRDGAEGRRRIAGSRGLLRSLRDAWAQIAAASLSLPGRARDTPRAGRDAAGRTRLDSRRSSHCCVTSQRLSASSRRRRAATTSIDSIRSPTSASASMTGLVRIEHEIRAARHVLAEHQIVASQLAGSTRSSSSIRWRPPS